MSKFVEQNPCTEFSWFDQENNKDDTGTADQITFVLALTYTLYLASLVLTNIRDIIRSRRNMKITKLLRVNLFILVFVVVNIAIFGDGLVSLFNTYGYLSLRYYYILQYSGLAIMELSLLVAAYSWASPLMSVYQFDLTKGRFLRKIISFSLGSVITITLLVSDYIMISSDNFCYLINTYSNGLNIWISVMVIAMQFNTVMATVLSLLLAKKITRLYEYKSNQKATRMRTLAILTVIGLSFRIIKDGLQIFGIDIVSALENKAITVNATIEQQLPWSIVNFLYLTFCGLIPMTFLANNFSVSTTQKTMNSDSESKDVKIAMINNSTYASTKSKSDIYSQLIPSSNQE